MIKRRWIAGAVDAALVCVLAYAAAWALQSALLIWPVATLVYALIVLVFLRLRDATPGQVLAGLRLTGAGCGPCWVLRWLGPFFALFVLAEGVEHLLSWDLPVTVVAILILLNIRAAQVARGPTGYDRAAGLEVTLRT